MRHAELNLPQMNGGSTDGFTAKYNLQMEHSVSLREIHLIVMKVNADGTETPATADYIEEFQLSLNGDTIYDVSGLQLEMIEKFKSTHTQDGRVVVPFADFSLTTQQSQAQTSLVILPGENVVMKVKTKPRVVADDPVATVTQLRVEARAVYAPLPATQRRLFVPHLTSDTLKASRTGDNKIEDFIPLGKSGNKLNIRRMHVMTSRVQAVQIKRGKVEIFDATADDNNYSLQRYGMTPQQIANNTDATTGIYHIDPIKTGFGIVDQLDGRRGRFDIVADLSAAGDYEVLFESLEDLRSDEEKAAGILL